jgi:hypothetical protein
MRTETNLFKGLLDFKFRKYISRQVIAFVYAFFFFVIVIATPFITYYLYDLEASNYTGGSFQPKLILIILGVPIFTLGLIIFLRLQFERYVAIVNTAENTERTIAKPE